MSVPYIPTTAEEKEEAFRLAAELFREVQKDLEQDPISSQAADETKDQG